MGLRNGRRDAESTGGEAVSEWQTIDSAPKDRYVLLYDAGYDNPYLHAKWDKHARGWWSQSTNSGHSIVWRDATHWMPLPEPPK